MPVLVGEVLEAGAAVDVGRVAGPRLGARRASYSSRISPMSSSTRSSRVTMPSVPPYSSTTTARCVPSWRMVATRGSTGLVPGSNSTGRARLAHEPVGRGVDGQQVADVQEAEHVVEVLARHRVARVGHVPDQRGGLGQAAVGRRRRRRRCADA